MSCERGAVGEGADERGMINVTKSRTAAHKKGSPLLMRSRVHPSGLEVLFVLFRIHISHPTSALSDRFWVLLAALG